jgi:hypothetical protein
MGGAENTPTQLKANDCGRTTSIRRAAAELQRAYALGCVMRAFAKADYRIRLRTFLTLDNVELDLVAFFKRLVAVKLNRRVMNEHIRPVIATDESVALGVVKPLDLPFVLSHSFRLPFSCGDPVSLREISHRYLLRRGSREKG